uniref:NADH dehydrogenase subunit 2 n=1 Tax=Allacta hainanensis TaxID=3037030 RepID=UPI00279C982F|nr:NADH dehydrogenase subunit 2 [Allacta hainanensis]WGO56989.1 NADH dehydrogenase subunit 2 [Allacta hainanensis]
MFKNSTKILFHFTLIGGILLTISSNSWMGAWMGLEINLLSFIPIMNNAENIYTTEASMKYFLIQALSSSMLLFMILMTFIEMFNMSIRIDMLNMIPLMLKSGVSPFHWWFPVVMEGLSWKNCAILMTLQKMAPMILIMNIFQSKFLPMMFIMISILVGSLGGLNQISIRKMLTYSSINHMGWLLSTMLISEILWMIYFMIYSILTITITLMAKTYNISFINQTFSMNNYPILKFLLFLTLLSLGGLPPFSGFFPKWIIVQFMMKNNFVIMNTIMIILSLITLYYYLRITYSAFLITHTEISWKIHFYQNKFSMFISWMSMMSTFGLLLISMPLMMLL